MTEPCILESQMTEMKVHYAYIKDRLEKQDVKLDKLVDAINDDGIKGRLTKNETNTQKQWWWIGGLSLAALGEFIRQIFKS